MGKKSLTMEKKTTDRQQKKTNKQTTDGQWKKTKQTKITLTDNEKHTQTHKHRTSNAGIVVVSNFFSPLGKEEGGLGRRWGSRNTHRGEGEGQGEKERERWGCQTAVDFHVQSTV